MRQCVEHGPAEVLVAEPDDEVSTAEIRKDEAFAKPERRARELLHPGLLRRHRGALLPEPAQRECVGLLFRHKHRNLRDNRLALENRLRRRPPVVRVALLDDRIEVDVLILQRMHELVGHHHAELQRLDIFGNVEGVGIGIVIAGNLFGEHVDHRRPQLERIGNQPEQAERRLQSAELGGWQVLIDLVNEVVANLGACPAQDERFALEGQSRGLRDDGHHVMHHVLQLRFALNRLRTLAARSEGDEDRDPAGGSRQPAHSIPFPMATPTTRATSFPVTTMPWRSSSARRRPSRSARWSSSAEGRRTSPEGGGGSSCGFLRRPSPPSSSFSSSPNRCSTVARSGIGSSGTVSSDSPRRISASTFLRSRISLSSSGETSAVAWACAQASSSTSIALSGRARSGTNRSVSTIAAFSASSEIATAWCRSSRGRRATSTSHV